MGKEKKSLKDYYVKKFTQLKCYQMVIFKNLHYFECREQIKTKDNNFLYLLYLLCIINYTVILNCTDLAIY